MPMEPARSWLLPVPVPERLPVPVLLPVLRPAWLPVLLPSVQLPLERPLSGLPASWLLLFWQPAWRLLQAFLLLA